jgi:hypothetical protein
MIKEGVTPPDPDNPKGPLEDHVTKRAADRAENKATQSPKRPAAPRGGGA